MSRAKAMLISHSVVFLLGVTAAKLHDRDELQSYRGAYEKPMQRFRRWAGNAAMGTVALGSLWVALNVVGGGDKKATAKGGHECC
mmetsp:Transcript_13271/g.31007  ORF Transcript_13271/g.31007 Transcript_13271/m.31007 type:complete len:85 (+) Transcript_13271:344-598(+)